MQKPLSPADRTETPYISTGHLPDPEMVQKLVAEAHARFKSNTEGQNSQVYPALARVPSDLKRACDSDTSFCTSSGSGRWPVDIYGCSERSEIDVGNCIPGSPARAI